MTFSHLALDSLRQAPCFRLRVAHCNKSWDAGHALAMAWAFKPMKEGQRQYPKSELGKGKNYSKHNLSIQTSWLSVLKESKWKPNPKLGSQVRMMANSGRKEAKTEDLWMIWVGLGFLPSFLRRNDLSPCSWTSTAWAAHMAYLDVMNLESSCWPTYFRKRIQIFYCKWQSYVYVYLHFKEKISNAE